MQERAALKELITVEFPPSVIPKDAFDAEGSGVDRSSQLSFNSQNEAVGIHNCGKH